MILPKTDYIRTLNNTQLQALYDEWVNNAQKVRSVLTSVRERMNEITLGVTVGEEFLFGGNKYKVTTLDIDEVRVTLYTKSGVLSKSEVICHGWKDWKAGRNGATPFKAAKFTI